MSSQNALVLDSLHAIKTYFAQNTTPYYFVSASNFNLLELHRWVRQWTHINLLDCFDGQHPHMLIAEDDHSRVFESIEDVNAYLLAHPKTKALFAQQATPTPANVVFLFFDAHIEAQCRALGLNICLPPNALVKEIDSKIVTTQLGNQAGVHSVPNVLAPVRSYAALCALAKQHQLGERWVIQTAYGDSGKTTFFIQNEDDYQRHAPQIEQEDVVKVMRWIRCVGTAIEACATRWGTFVGPLLTEMIGIDALTPYAGGWCGNELYASAFSESIRTQVMQKTQAMGDALYAKGYRGYFELDYLLDLDTGDVYLGELNARITGISAMTNMSDFSEHTIPLFLFHLLEYNAQVQLRLDVAAYNQQVLQQGATGTASQVILKHTQATLEVITHAPVSGVYQLQGETLVLKQEGYTRRDALAPDEAFILRIMQVGEYAYKGGDLAIMFLNQVIRTPEGQLNTTGNLWINALKNTFAYRALTQEEKALLERYHHPTNIKTGQYA